MSRRPEMLNTAGPANEPGPLSTVSVRESSGMARMVSITDCSRSGARSPGGQASEPT